MQNPTSTLKITLRQEGHEQALSRLLERCLKREWQTLNSGWEDVLWAAGMAALGRACGSEKLLDWARTWANGHLDGEFSELPFELGFNGFHPGFVGICLNDYCGNWGMPLVLGELHAAASNDRWIEQSDRFARHIMTQSTRVGDGVIAHAAAPDWVRTVWVDTLYYTAPVLAVAWQLTGNEDYLDEALRQCRVHAEILRDPLTGLYYHDGVPGQVPNAHAYWARGNGWIIMAIADTLAAAKSAGKKDATVTQLERQLHELASVLLRHRHPGGLWPMVLDNPESHLETSGSAMIAKGITRALRAELLPPFFRPELPRTLQGLLSQVDRLGALTGAQRPAGHGGWETHRHSFMGECTYATGILLSFLAELVDAGEIKLTIEA